MKWFKHDSMANRDAKLEKVLLKYGSDGYALYWLCLELIADRIDREHTDFELEHDAETLGARLHVDTLRVEEIMRYFVTLQLFESDSERITCLKLAARLENSIVKSPEIKRLQDEISAKIPDYPGKSRIIPEKSGQIRLDKIRIDKDTEESKKATADGLRLAALLKDLHTVVDAKRKVTSSDVSRWALDIDKLSRIDGRSIQDIDAVIKWCKQPDNFWFPNIISGKKLREKFTTLYTQMIRDKKPIQRVDASNTAIDSSILNLVRKK